MLPVCFVDLKISWFSSVFLSPIALADYCSIEVTIGRRRKSQMCENDWNCAWIVCVQDGFVVCEAEEKPAWLDALLTDKFFVPCAAHETAKKNEKNIFCLDCCRSICPHCLPVHRGHRLLQVKKFFSSALIDPVIQRLSCFAASEMKWNEMTISLRAGSEICLSRCHQTRRHGEIDRLLICSGELH